MLVIFFGFIALVAFNQPLLATKIGAAAHFGIAHAAGALEGQVDRQALNWAAIVMFFLFVLGTLGIAYRAAVTWRARDSRGSQAGGARGWSPMEARMRSIASRAKVVAIGSSRPVPQFGQERMSLSASRAQQVRPAQARCLRRARTVRTRPHRLGVIAGSVHDRQMDTKRSVVVARRSSRQSWPVDLKRRIVEETLAPGAPVALIARHHGVNANLLFNWRRLNRRGGLGSAKVPAPAAVKIVEPAGHVVPRRPLVFGARVSSGVIEIELGPDLRLRAIGAPDAATIAACVRAMRAP